MNTEHTNQSRQAANAAFEQWWQRHGLTDPMDDEDRQYATASSWARRGYLAAMQSQQAEPVEVHGLGTPNVDVSVHDGKVVHYDNGPNLAEALARLASRVAKVRNLPAPTITAQPTAVAAPAELRSVFDEMFDYSVDPTDDVSREWLWRFSKGLVGRLSSKPPVQQHAAPVALSLPFFVYDSETGFERFATEVEAKAAAQESIEAYREDAGEGWAEEVENICWGIVLGATREVALPDEYSGGNGLADSMKPVDYVLTDAAQPPAVAVPQEVAESIRSPFNACCNKEHCRAMLAAAPQGADPIKRLIAMHNELLGEYPYCYFELAYTRRTDWMAWLCTKPREDDPERKVLACGQGLTAEEACAEAISAAQKGGAA